MAYVPTCTIKNIQANVGKYTSPMDAMGIDLMINVPYSILVMAWARPKISLQSFNEFMMRCLAWRLLSKLDVFL